MKVVVADTSPLNYLVQIGAVDILPQLYETVVIPPEVFWELSDPDAPLAVRNWIREVPAWVEVRSPTNQSGISAFVNLDAGERAAIQLAGTEADALLLMDDAAGRRVAAQVGLLTIGTLGLLRLAALEGLIELLTVLGRLTQTNFRAPDSLIRQLIDEDEERRRPR